MINNEVKSIDEIQVGKKYITNCNLDFIKKDVVVKITHKRRVKVENTGEFVFTGWVEAVSNQGIAIVRYNYLNHINQ